MIKYANIDLLIKEVGEVEAPEALHLTNEPVIDAYNSGNEGVLNRLVTVEKSTLVIDGEEISFDFPEGVLKNFPSWIDSKVGKIRMLVDSWTGKVYSQVKQGKDTQLFFHSNMKVVAESFETRKEGSEEVVFKVTAPLWKKLVEDKWIVDIDMRPLTDESITTSLHNFIGE